MEKLLLRVKRLKKRYILIPILLALIVFLTQVIIHIPKWNGYTMDIPLFPNKVFYIYGDVPTKFIFQAFKNRIPEWEEYAREEYTREDSEFSEIVDMLNSFRFSARTAYNTREGSGGSADCIIWCEDRVGFSVDIDANAIFVEGNSDGSGYWYYTTEEGYFDRLVELGGGTQKSPVSSHSRAGKPSSSG